jgi:ubiquinone/menaquinone biosynthesis C-methylase UbiE
LWLKAQPDQQHLVRACYYDEPVLTAAQRFAESEEWQAVCQVLQYWMPGRVLDLGAGNGISSYAFARSGCQVTAIDPDPSLIVGIKSIRQLSREANMPMDLVQTSGERIPFKDGTFDIVYGRQVLHHAKDLEQLCREAARVLRAGGVLMATREHVISSREDLSLFFESHPLHGLYGGENAFSLREYYRAIRKVGLRLKKVYGPHQSVINYFPMSCSENHEKLNAVLEGFLGKCFARLLSRQDQVQALLGWCYSVRDRTPGRLYSFVAVK